MASAQTLALTLKALSATFGREVTADTLEAYKLGVGDLSDVELQRAAANAIRTCQRFPVPAELRALAGRGQSIKAEAAEAWGRVQEAMDTLYDRDGVDFGLVANAVVRNMGGWARLWNEPFRALPFVRRKFEELYETFSASAPGEMQGAAIPPGLGGRMALRLPAGASPTPFQQQVTGIVRDLAELKSHE